MWRRALGAVIGAPRVYVGNALTRGGLVESMVPFLSYALGVAAVAVNLTLAIGAFTAVPVRGLRRVVPYVQRASAVLLLVTHHRGHDHSLLETLPVTIASPRSERNVRCLTRST